MKTPYSASTNLNVLFLLTTGLTLQTDAAADEPPPPSTRPSSVTVNQLIEKLNSDRRSERLAAERGLLELGPSILDQLPTPTLLPNAQVRDTVRRIRLELERRKARQAVDASRVSLVGTMTLDEIAAEIAKQTGNVLRISDRDPATRKRAVALAIDDAPFWKAIEELCREADLELAGGATLDNSASPLDGPAVDLVTRANREPAERVSLDGAVRARVAKTSIRELFGDDEHDKLRVAFDFHVEPRLRPLFLKYRGRDINVATGNGRKRLKPLANADDNLELPLGQDGGRISIHSDFRFPKLAPREQALNIAGKLSVQCAAATERIQVSSLKEAKGVIRRRGGVTLSMRNVEVTKGKTGQDVNVQCVVTYDIAGAAFESHRTWINHNRVLIETETDSGFERLAPDSHEVDGQAKGGIMITYTFRNLDDRQLAGTFVYYAPTMIVDVPITFHFKDVRVRDEQ